MEKLKKELKEWWELKWLWGPMLIGFSILFGYMYYKSHYCKQIPCIRIGKRCIKSHIEDNGYRGKYHKEWEVCDEEETYEYESTYDSCGCTKLK